MELVIKPLTKSKLGHEFVSTNKPISCSTVKEYFNSTFKDIVYIFKVGLSRWRF